ncbi:MAG: hypothetical protein KBD01_16125 [Acidobacteria bacterium]|nr:hypothetical protein [Acidobacteriota bacterium]
MDSPRRYSAGSYLDDLCRACKTVRRHTVIVADAQGQPLRVVCDFCGSQHNYRGGAERAEASAPAASRGAAPPAAAPSPAAPSPAAGVAPGTGRVFPLVSERERRFPPVMVEQKGEPADLELLLRRVVREESGLTAVAPADKWRGGEMVLRPGREGVQDKSWPIETFFHKVVMLRNRLRVLEQQINAAEIPDDVKLRLQSHITGCYGTLTSFNVLFADEDDRFKGSGADEP